MARQKLSMQAGTQRSMWCVAGWCVIVFGYSVLGNSIPVHSASAPLKPTIRFCAGGNCPVRTLCGNATIESGEACDMGFLNNQTCQTQGFSGGGTLACNPPGSQLQCQFDTRQCGSVLPQDITPPVFITGGTPAIGFDVQPRSVSSSGPTIFWNIRDETALARVEIFRASFKDTLAIDASAVQEGGTWDRLISFLHTLVGISVADAQGSTLLCNEGDMSGCQWQMITSIPAFSNPWQGSWVDTTIMSQPDNNYWYGIQVFDQTGNRLIEPAPIKVTKATPQQSQPNLVASSVTASPTTITVGGSVALGGLVANTGTASTNAVTSARYCYGVTAPQDCITGASGTVIGNNTIQVLATGVSFNPSRTWKPTTAGTYTIVLCADAGKIVSESSEIDNCSLTPVTVVVQIPVQ